MFLYKSGNFYQNTSNPLMSEIDILTKRAICGKCTVVQSKMELFSMLHSTLTQTIKHTKLYRIPIAF